ncbi:MAG: 16S rRNA (uracil(1498)-N(3))-methyltransferase [Oligoflexia bacterium]|nr:16S rRNA (uracil(1498)-N(3))-methyltransferase [Oligoflexia bacterium]
MRFFYYENLLEKNHSISLDEIESNHIAKVLRLSQNDEIYLMNGRGQKAKAVISIIRKKEVIVDVLEVTTEFQKNPKLTLCQANLKPQRMDWLIEKITEVGVDEVKLFASQYSQITNFKVDRFKKIAISACKQSENSFVPTITQFPTFSDILNQPKTDIKIILDPQTKISLQKVLSSAGDLQNVKNIIILVGPEGGFSSQEIEQAINAGFQASSLGPRILRGETAGIVSSALCRHFIDFSVP